MNVEAQFDLDVVALQGEDDLTCLLTFQAPVPEDLADRPGETLVAVVDNSGSMQGTRLSSVKQALHALVDRMRPQDTFCVVTFNTTAQVCVPTRSIADHHLPSVHSLIESIGATGGTDLAAGYLLGIAEAERAGSKTGASVILLSDGHVNGGISDPVQLGGLALSARHRQVSTITIGIGNGYDEVLLNEIATKGQGHHRFAFTPDDAIAVVAEEAGDLLSKAIINAFLRIRPADPSLLDGIGTLHGIPSWIDTTELGSALTIPLGDLYSGETRELLVTFHIPGLESLGQHAIGDFVLDYVSLPAIESKTITWPITVNVVPGSEAALRMPNPIVTTAALIAEVTNAKREASEALVQGDAKRAERLIRTEVDKLGAAVIAMDRDHDRAVEICGRLDEERDQLEKLARAARHRSAKEASLSLMEDLSMNLRGRNDEKHRKRARERRDF